MAKKKKRQQETTIEDFYDLKVDKVDELVAALKDDLYEFDNEVSMNINDCTGIDDPKNVKRSGKQKQFDPYKNDFLSRIPTWLKALFIKFWFAGLACYFIMFGLDISDSLDNMILLGAVMGLIVDVLVNPIFRFLESDRREYNAYMMFPFPFKAFWTFFTNIIYYVIIVICVNYCYYGLDMLINYIAGRTDFYIAVGVEPLLFGVICVMVDMVFIGIKDGIVALVKKLSNRKKETADV